jgi:GNAT superfamily N-acetyltransferase
VTGGSDGIRPADLDDLPGLLALDHKAAAGDAERAADLRRFVRAGDCHVHVERDHLDGYVALTPRHFLGRDFVDLLFVTPFARRSGVGSRLLRAALELEGTAQVFTSTNRSNTPMRELLRLAGWQFSGELDGLDDGDPEMFFFAWRS